MRSTNVQGNVQKFELFLEHRPGQAETYIFKNLFSHLNCQIAKN